MTDAPAITDERLRDRIFLSDSEKSVLRASEPVLAALGYDVVHVEVVGGGQRGGRTVRFFIDKTVPTYGDDGKLQNVAIDDCVRASRELDVVLDVEDVITGSFQLEVSTPGLDRQMGRRLDFQVHTGKVGKIETSTPINNRRRWAGTLRGLQGADILIEVDGVVHAVPFDLIRKASLKYDFERDTAGNR